MIICDLDGTLTMPDTEASMCMGASHSKEQILRIMDPARIAGLKPRHSIITRVNAERANGRFVVILTGRWDLLRSITVSWLRRNKIGFNLCAMRAHDRWRESSVDVKTDMFETLRKEIGRVNDRNEVLWLDDDPAMIDRCARLGVNAELVV